MKRTQKPLTQDELQRYERALILWEQGLKRETEQLDEREAELEEREAELGIVSIEEITQSRHKSLVFDDDGCTITPQEFVTTIKPCGNHCYEGGEHAPDCARMIYLEVERLGKLGENK